MSLVHYFYDGRQVLRCKLVFEEDTMEPAIVYVWTDGEEPKRMYHSRKGLTECQSDATRFKTLNHALRTARKEYRDALVTGVFKSYNIITVKGE